MAAETVPIFRSPAPLSAEVASPLLRALRRLSRERERPAIIDAETGERLTFAELADQSAALARGLAALGIGRGDVVASPASSAAAWIVAALGTWRAGAAFVPLRALQPSAAGACVAGRFEL